MKKRMLVLLVAVSMIMMTACSSATESSEVETSEETSTTEATTTTEETTEESIEETNESSIETTVPPEASPELVSAAYMEYLDTLENNSDDIGQYNWLPRYADQEESAVITQTENLNVALCDCSHDGLKEMFFMAQSSYDCASLYIYSYNPDSGLAALYLKLVYIDRQDSEHRYLIGLNYNGDLVVYLNDEDLMRETYSLYSYNSETNNMTEVLNAMIMYDRDEIYYRLGITEVSEEEFLEVRDEIMGGLTTIILYNNFITEDLPVDITSLPCEAMDYDQLHDILESEI